MERIIPDVMKPEPKAETAVENINPMFEEERADPYGYCPICASPGKMRSKNIGATMDICELGHEYPSEIALTAKPDCPDCVAGRLHEHTKKEEAVPAPQKQTARFENVNEGLCPSCGQQMRLSTANGIPVHVCMEHSVVMPIRDPEPLNVQ